MRTELFLRTVVAILFAGILSLNAAEALAGERERIEQTESRILKIVQMAKDSRFAKLEAMAAERKAYADAHPEMTVGYGDIFAPFQRADPELAGPLKEWRARYPESFAPHLAFGLYSSHLGWVVRGEYTAGLTNAQRFGEMRRYFEESVSALRMAVRLNPKLPKAWGRLIGMASAGGKAFEVDDLFEEAVRHVPGSSYLYETYYGYLAPKWSGSDTLQRALKGRIQDNFADDPKFGWIETVADDDKAWELYWDNKMEPALALFEKVIALRPDFSSRHGRAMTLIYLKRLDDSIDEFQRVLAEDPGNSKIYAELALAQSLDRERRDAAMKSMNRALLFNPYHPDFLRRRARMYLDRHEMAAAKRDLDKALLLGAYDDQVRNQLRAYYWQIGDMAKAVEEAEKMLTLAPARTKNWMLYAVTLMHNQDCRALKAFETYLQQCLMKKECNAMRQQQITLDIRVMKGACS